MTHVASASVTNKSRGAILDAKGVWGVDWIDGIGNENPATIVQGENIHMSGGTGRLRIPIGEETWVRHVATKDSPDGLLLLTSDL